MPRSPAADLGDDPPSSTPDPENTNEPFRRFCHRPHRCAPAQCLRLRAPAGSSNAFDADAMAKNTERAMAACGAGNVKEVNAKSFVCK
ncbi:type IV pilus biogenesis protein CpaD/CtpE [Pelomonas aquatica]|uniref:Type IV pilus biogenesis protein CpaD/CtpE n=1 Tax=Pelomonas aquatica TaxID=431058 RepID=A0ABU1Z9R1_9BURK|nr:hypothetical protein [Pelomonas aquatica]MDR7297363.1 type IV pilus biogenesis protein CpaD/CtpE [Pelomonas aquatica]